MSSSKGFSYEDPRLLARGSINYEARETYNLANVITTELPIEETIHESNKEDENGDLIFNERANLDKSLPEAENSGIKIVGNRDLVLAVVTRP